MIIFNKTTCIICVFICINLLYISGCSSAIDGKNKTDRNKKNENDIQDIKIESDILDTKPIPTQNIENGTNVILYETEDVNLENLVEKALVNKNATNNTKRLMSYLVDQYGINTLSGQYQVVGGINSNEFKAIHKITGKYPAIMGLDLIDYSPSRVENGATSNSTQDAIIWHKQGGIVKFLWHWNAPKDLVETKRNPWWKGFYSKATVFNLEDALNGKDTEGYQLIIRDIDVIAKQLKILQDNDVPILWRPIHEASGGWFWWGAYGPENFKKLWIIMYERLTYDNGLNNLIWIYNGESADWYPGDEYVDIIGEDIYADSYDYDSQGDVFHLAKTYTRKDKIIALSENGVIPDPDLMYEEDIYWSFFATWCDEFVIDNKTGKPTDKYMEFEYLKKVFNHSRIITLDELPDLSKYPMK